MKKAICSGLVVAVSVLLLTGRAWAPPPPHAGLAGRVAALEAAVSTLQAENASQQSLIDALSGEVASLQAALEAADAALAERVTALETGLATEITARTDGDGVLDSRCDSLEDDLANEATTRADKDDYLQSLIDAIDVPQNLLDFANHIEVYPDALNDLAGPQVMFHDANFHFRNSGLVGSTDIINGLGNVIVGYNEKPSTGFWPVDPRIGSHNLVVGDWNVYPSYGCLVAGRANKASGPYSTVSGGNNNTASGYTSSVSGGFRNEAIGMNSSVTGGQDNTASAQESTVSGGYGNSATSRWASDAKPDYDSGWQDIAQDETLTLTHGLGGDPGNYVVEVEFWHSGIFGIHQVGFGGDRWPDFPKGAYWHSLSDQSIEVSRMYEDNSVERVRVRIWVNK